VCYLITFAVPQGHAAVVSHSRVPRVAAHANGSLATLFGKAFALFSITDGGCSCRLFSAPSVESRAEPRQRSLRQKYERLGWSPEKIERALTSSEDTLQAKTQASPGGLRLDVATYIADLAQRSEEVRLVVHEFRGSFVDEVVPVSRRVTLTAAELSGHAARIEEDVVYIIRSSTRR
jgi:hypothetical protein